MSISAHARHRLPKSEFGLPEEEKYPVDTRGRAVAAKGRATQQARKGSLSAEDAARIKAKANEVLGERKRPALSADRKARR